MALNTLSLALSLFLLGDALATGSPQRTAGPSCRPPVASSSAWEARDPAAAQILLEAGRIVIRQKGAIRVATIVRREKCQYVVRDQGLLTTWTLTGNSRELRWRQGKGPPLTLIRLSDVPTALSLAPWVFPEPRQLPAEKVKVISAALLEKAKQDQAVINAPPQDPGTAEVLASNLQYLKQITLEVGWIDIPRFGKQAAAAAALIAKHGGDLPLLQAAVPLVERDARDQGGSGEMLSVLVDETLLLLGKKQKYGTQIAEDENGQPFVLPVEDPAKVDELRKAIGILPWSEYLTLARKHLYNGMPIRMPKIGD